MFVKHLQNLPQIMKRSTIFEVQSGEFSNKRQRQTSPMDQIIQNPAFQQLTEESKSRLIHWAINGKNFEPIKILAPHMKSPNAPDEYGETPIAKATRLLGPNHDIVQFLQTFEHINKA